MRERISSRYAEPVSDKSLSVTRVPVVAPLSPRAALRWPLIKRAMRQARPTTTLEVGCGQGAMGARMVDLTPYFTALEPDSASFEVARPRIEGRGGTALNCFSTDLENDSSFDMVCAFEVLEHIDDDAAALDEWRGHVRVGGHLLLSVPAWQHMFGPWDTLAGHYRRYSPAELDDKLRAAGFEPVTTRLYGWPLAFIMEVIRDRLADRLDKKEDTLVQQSTHSGRVLQPSKRLTDIAITVGVFPFQVLQRLVPGKGNGIVALARRVR